MIFGRNVSIVCESDMDMDFSMIIEESMESKIAIMEEAFNLLSDGVNYNVIQEGFIRNTADRIKNMLKKLWERIVNFFKSVFSIFSKKEAADKVFIEKHKDEIEKTAQAIDNKGHQHPAQKPDDSEQQKKEDNTQRTSAASINNKPTHQLLLSAPLSKKSEHKVQVEPKKIKDSIDGFDFTNLDTIEASVNKIDIGKYVLTKELLKKEYEKSVKYASKGDYERRNELRRNVSETSAIHNQLRMDLLGGQFTWGSYGWDNKLFSYFRNKQKHPHEIKITGKFFKDCAYQLDNSSNEKTAKRIFDKIHKLYDANEKIINTALDPIYDHENFTKADIENAKLLEKAGTEFSSALGVIMQFIQAGFKAIRDNESQCREVVTLGLRYMGVKDEDIDV